MFTSNAASPAKQPGSNPFGMGPGRPFSFGGGPGAAGAAGSSRPDGDTGKRFHVSKIELHKVDLTTISDEAKFLPWRAKFDLEVDDIWSALEEVLKIIRVMKTPCTPENI